MKVLVIFALLVACANASVLSKITEKFIPSFATGHIIQGIEAEPRSAPYIVSLSANASKIAHKCGGTIISKDWILTAAHCITNPIGMGVTAGLHKRSNFTDNVQNRTVDFGKVHAQFSGGVGPYDIALLHVSEPFIFNQWVQPAILPTPAEINKGSTHLYGWGQPTALAFGGSDTLLTVKTDILKWNKCNATLPANAKLFESNLCTDSLGKGISACNGDSGGPLVLETKGVSSQLIGIVSWGFIPCGRGNMPSIYTRVSAYIEWIIQIQNSYYSLY